MKKFKRFTQEEKEKAISLYKTGDYTCPELGEIFGKTGEAFLYMFKREGIPILNNRSILSRKYLFDESYFDAIDTKEKAYFLGLMYADGYNHEKSGSITITLQERDRQILEEFSKDLKSTKPLEFFPKKKDSHQNSVRLLIHSKRASRQLKDKGCHQKKSLTLKFPSESQVPKRLLRFFMRGYFDGDGGISRTNKSTNVAVTSCFDFLVKFREIIKNETGLSGCLRVSNALLNGKKTDGYGVTSVLSFGGRRQSLVLLKWLYEDGGPRIMRKYDKIKEISMTVEKDKEKWLIPAFGEKKTLTAWLKDDRCIVKEGTVYKRLKHGIPLEEAITTKRLYLSKIDKKQRKDGRKAKIRSMV